MVDPFIIMSAPNGARRLKADHAQIPLTPHEMARCAEEIIAAGASILHLHVRDDRGGHSLDVDRYRASIATVRDAVGDDIIIQATSEAVGKYSHAEQRTMVKELRPEAVSLALRELCPDGDSLSDFSRFIQWMDKENIFPQYILYDEDDYQRFEAYRKQGVFHDDRPFTLFVLGNYQEISPESHVIRLKECTQQAVFPWAVCGFGIHESEAVSHAAKNTGHIRVGFENSLLRADGQMLENNAEMVKFCAQSAHDAGRTAASADDVRNLFNL